MQTSRRDIFLLACCQALLLINASGLISMSGLVGFSLVETKALATFGATTYVLGSALATMPMSLWMGKVGRRTGFMTGAAINVIGCLVGALALQARSFPLFCVATAIIGVYNAVGLQYRFAAAEVADPGDRAKAISLVLAGGALTVVAVFVALNGISVAHFVAALMLVGVGWNFMYTGGTTLLTETYRPNEKARTQGLNDFVVFATMAVSSLASGALVTTTGWETMNRAALPFLAIIAVAALWLIALRRHRPLRV